MLFSISSNKSNDDFISPVPSQAGHFSTVLMSVTGRTRSRVNCTNPNLLGGNIVWRARSSFISSRNVSKSCFLFNVLLRSIKSITIIPPISRKRSWRAISFAAAIFTFNALLSCVSTAPLFRPPLFTSITCIASVCSTIRYDPPLSVTVLPNNDLICLSIPKCSKMEGFPL